MLIGIDGNEANLVHRVGIGEFAFETIKWLEKLTSNAEEEGSDESFVIYLKNNPLDVLPQTRQDWRYRVIKPAKFWTQFALPLDLFLHRPRPHVFFTPTHYAPRFSPVPTVISIMDLSYELFPYLFKKRDLMQLRAWTSYSVKKASKIITISQSSKHDIIKFYRVKAEKIAVVYPGIKKENQKMSERAIEKIRRKYVINKNFILFVGTLQPRKNIVKLIEAFSGLLADEENRDLQLVIVGKKGWLYKDILSSPEKYGVKEKVIFLDFVPDEDMPALYRNARCFVLPSLYEGFGLPILEAMKFGCPVLTSNVSSLPEAGGRAAIYFDPDNVDEIKNSLAKILHDTKLRQELIERGYKQIEKFSWEKASREILQILREVHQGSLTKM